MTYSLLDWSLEILRETFEGERPGAGGTLFLDKTGGIRQTLSELTPEQASARFDQHPSIAAHVRHMAFHLCAVAEWIEGDRRSRDWPGSFEPQTVNASEWKAVQAELEMARQRFEAVLRGLTPEQLVENGAGMGALAHLAYHLGAIRQLVHRVR